MIIEILSPMTCLEDLLLSQHWRVQHHMDAEHASMAEHTVRLKNSKRGAYRG